jgi:hypothetical protein
MNQMSMAGKPRTATGTQTISTPQEPVNIGQLGMLLYMLMQMDQDGGTKNLLGATPTPAARTLPALPFSQPESSAFPVDLAQADPLALFEYIMGASA